MAPTGVDSQAAARWLITPLAASPASFQPSKAAITAGELSFPMPSSSIWDHLLGFLRGPDYVHEHDRRVTWPAADELTTGRGQAGRPAQAGRGWHLELADYDLRQPASRRGGNGRGPQQAQPEGGDRQAPGDRRRRDGLDATRLSRVPL